MGIRANNLDTVKLSLELLKRIPRNGAVSAPELHRQLLAININRSKRTIERQLAALVEHFDIECDITSKPYSYRWKAQSRGLSLPGLNQQESLLLALAQRYLQNLLPASVMQSMGGFFRQARNNLVSDAGAPLDTKPEREWLSKVRVVDVSQPLLPATINPRVFEAVSTALYQNRWLTVDYKNAAGRRAEYNIMPLGLVQQGPSLYLVCRYEGYNNERNLAMHRIKSACVSGLDFKRPPEFNLQKYDEDGRFGFGDGLRIKLSFCIAKRTGRHLLETRLSKDQVVVEHDEHYSIVATVIDSVRLDCWLKGFGADVWDVVKNNE